MDHPIVATRETACAGGFFVSAAADDGRRMMGIVMGAGDGDGGNLARNASDTAERRQASR